MVRWYFYYIKKIYCIIGIIDPIIENLDSEIDKKAIKSKVINIKVIINFIRQDIGKDILIFLLEKFFYIVLVMNIFMNLT